MALRYSAAASGVAALNFEDFARKLIHAEGRGRFLVHLQNCVVPRLHVDLGGFVENVGVVGKALLELREHRPDFGETILREVALHQRNPGEPAKRRIGIAGELLLQDRLGPLRTLRSPRGSTPERFGRSGRRAMPQRSSPVLSRLEVFATMKRLDRVGRGLSAEQRPDAAPAPR